MTRPAPLSFLAAVIGCWVGFRLFVLWPAAPADALVEPVRSAQPRPPASRLPLGAGAEAPFVQVARAFSRGRHRTEQAFAAGLMTASKPAAQWTHAAAQSLAAPGNGPPLHPLVGPSLAIGPVSYPPLTRASSGPLPPSAAAGERRWSGSAWLFLRDEGGAALAPGGTLGGSQAGVRVSYRIAGDVRRPVAVSARLYTPGQRPEGAEAALGIDWKPMRAVPLHILAERRQRIGREGRSDFALTFYGGGERRLLGGRLRVEGYGQAGVVGLEERDLFADGAVRAGTPVGPAEIGAGVWGGAQPGAARLDVGPQVGLRVPLGRGGVRVSAEWRFRVAGDAAPGSGPALTIGTDF